MLVEEKRNHSDWSKYIEKLREENPEKMQEYWKRAYQKRKEKKIQEQNIQDKN